MRRNVQEPIKVEKVAPKGDLISIEEIFYTLQGEGPFSGEPACFVRLAGCNLSCSACFVGTTKIAGPGKNKPISQLDVGDWVYSFNAASQSIEPKQVLNVMKRETDVVIKVTCTGTTKLYVTPEHPVFVKGVGWVEVQDLKVGDVLFHITPSDKMSLHNPSFNRDTVNKSVETRRKAGYFLRCGQRISEKWKDPNYGADIRKRMRESNPMRDEEVRKKSWTNRDHRLTNIERQVLNVIETNKLPIEFVGDGSFWVGAKCPDFRVIGTNKVVEVWDSTQSSRLKRDSSYIEERKNYFNSFGYDCLFLAYHQREFRDHGDPKGFGKKLCERWILEKLVEYIHNGEIVTGLEIIHPTTNPKAYVRLAGSLAAPITVYNIEVEGNKNYFANSILVHNCDTSYSSHIPFTIDEVVDKAKEVTPGHIKLCVVTGGEPFRQFLMPALVRKLLRRFETVQVETSGSCFQTAFKELAWEYGHHLQIVCSPKTVKLHKGIAPLIAAYKYVVRAGHVADDGLPDEEPQQFKKTPVARPEPNWTGGIPPIYISPWDECDSEKNAANIKAAVDSCLRHGYKLSLQIHKIVNLP